VGTILLGVGNGVTGTFYVNDIKVYQATPPVNTSKLFTRATGTKVATARTNWNSDAYMLWMNAKNGGSHNHKDSLHMVVWAKDRDILTDTGMTSYDSLNPAFDFQRHQTRSHNTIEIDDTPQRGVNGAETNYDYDDSINGLSSISMLSNSMFDYIDAWTDATLGFRHHRFVLFNRLSKYWIVSDMIEAPEGMHKYNQTWHMPPASGVYIDDDTDRGNSAFSTGTNIQIVPADPTDVTATLQSGYDSRSVNTTNYLSYVKNQSGNTAFDTLLCPKEQGQSVDASVKRLPLNVAQSIATAFTVNVNNDIPPAYYYLSYEDTPMARTFGNYNTNGKMAFIQNGAGDNAQFAALYYGTLLKQGNKNLISSNIQLTDFSVKWNGSTLEAYCSDEQLEVQATVTIYVPSSITCVRLNGRYIPYTQNSSYVTVELAKENIVQLTNSSVTNTSMYHEFNVAFEKPMDNATIYAAIYDEDGKLLGVETSPCGGDSYYSVNVPINVNTKKAKIFVWTDNLNPLGNEEILNME